MDTSDSITEHGLFWIKDRERQRLWGTLSIGEFDDARLETFGSLIATEEEKHQTIVGLIRGGQIPVTLLDCFPIKNQDFGPTREGELDWSHQTCHVNVVLEGTALEGDRPAAFAEAIVNISTLPRWVNPNLVKLEFSEVPSGETKVGISLNDREDETVVTTFKGKDIKVSIGFNPVRQWSWKGPITSYSAEDNCFLVLERADGGKLYLEDITSVTAAIQDLLTVCCNETSVVTGLNVRNQPDDRDSIRVFLRMKGYKAEKRGEFPYPALGYDDTGRMSGIARWLETTEKYHPSTAFLTAHWYNDTEYSSGRLSRTYTAVEGLIARKQNYTRANMKLNDLAQFVDQAIPGFHNITGINAEDWARKVKNIRNKTIDHLDPTGTPTTDGLTLLRMAEVLYVAGAAFLLREAGIEEPQIKKYIQGCYQSTLLR